MTDDAAPERQPRSWGTALYGALCLASLTGILMKIVPMFSEVFRQMKVPMPGWTLMLVSISDALCAVPWLVYPLVILLPLGVRGLKKETAYVVQTTISIAYALSAVGILISVFLPFMGLDHGIGARRH